MSWISNIFKKLGGFFNSSSGRSILGFGSSLLSGLFTANQNRNLMREQNEFNANQADINRQFQSKETEIARDWQERFYQQYQSPQAMVHQYEQAGINPVLAAGHATNTPPSATSSSGSMAQGVSPGYQSVGGIMEQFGKLALLKAEINNINADTEGKKAAAGASNAEAAYKTSLKSVTDAQLNLVNEQFRKVAAEATNEEYRKNILEIEKQLLDLQHEQELDEKEFKRKYGIYPNDSVGAMILKLADKFGSNFKDWLLNTMLGLQESVTLPDYTKQ